MILHLPLAIKLIAATLKSQEKHVWRSTLERLQKHVLDNKVQEIIEISYNYLAEKEREIFLLCGLYPEDSNIPIEDLTRYAWGLSLFEGVSTLGDARDRTETCVSNLKSAYLLMGSDGGKSGCVKMHDLVLAFVVGTVYKGEGKWIVHHADKSKWSEVKMGKSCERISLSCRGMSEFPSDLKFQNLSVLKLLDGDYSPKFPPDFYKEMKEIKVIGYKSMNFPLLPTSSQYSPNLRTLCLYKCNLSLDYSCIGNLINLEVLSFAKSNIRKLPSTFQNLKKLRLLDVSDCSILVIDDGVLGNLGKLEELYVGVHDKNIGSSFPNCNYEELAKISENLSALEIEFRSRLPAMLFKKLNRFKILVGHPSKDVGDMLWESDKVSYKNTLMLITDKDRLQKSRMNKLFEKTEYLYLEIDGMEHLEDVDVHPPPPSSSFFKLRFLSVAKCGKSSYLFTLNVAIALSRLENLSIAKCPIMESIIHIEGNGAHTITFSKLACLVLDDLPALSSLCNDVNEIQLPHLLELRLSGLPKFTSIYPKNELAISSFLNKQVVIPKVERLCIYDMRKLQEIWPSEYSSSEEVYVSMLRCIQVSRCNNLVNLFPSNPMPLLCHLEELEVEDCASINTLFNMDMDWISKTEECSSMLRRIEVCKCRSLVNLFPSNPTPLLGHLEEIVVVKCASIETLFDIHMERVSKLEDCSSMLKRIEVRECESLVNLFQSNPMPLLGHLEEIVVVKCDSIETLFNIDTDRVSKIKDGSSMSGRIKVSSCQHLVNLFPINPMPLLHHFKELEVSFCASIETLFKIDLDRVSEIEDGSSMLKRIEVNHLGKLREIWRVRFSGR